MVNNASQVLKYTVDGIPVVLVKTLGNNSIYPLHKQYQDYYS